MFQKLPKKSHSNKVAMPYRIMGINKLFPVGGKTELVIYLKGNRNSLALSQVRNAKQMILYISSKRYLSTFYSILLLYWINFPFLTNFLRYTLLTTKFTNYKYISMIFSMFTESFNIHHNPVLDFNHVSLSSLVSKQLLIYFLTLQICLS